MLGGSGNAIHLSLFRLNERIFVQLVFESPLSHAADRTIVGGALMLFWNVDPVSVRWCTSGLLNEGKDPRCGYYQEF